jgi:hypothetical protein
LEYHYFLGFPFLTQAVTNRYYLENKITNFMAHVKSNDITEGLSGRLGKLIFRTYKGKTYVARRPSKPKKESDDQRNTRSKFKLATQYAKQMMADPERKAYYTDKAKELALPNAYTAAITDYMRKPEIHGIDASKYNGKPEDRIAIYASKKGFKLNRVSVVVTSADDVVLEQGTADMDAGVWNYQSSLASNHSYSSYKIFVTAADEQNQLRQLMVQR